MRNFKTEDFSGAGQYLLRMSPDEVHKKENNLPFSGYCDAGFLSTIVKKVGWITNNYEIGDGEQIYTLTDMSDGMTLLGNYTSKTPKDNNYEKVIWQGEDGAGKQKLVDWLNNPELSQEHRFATQEEIVRVVMYQSSRWRN
jgi:hypothetical protein